MGIMVYSLLWVMQDFYHQAYDPSLAPRVHVSHLVYTLALTSRHVGIQQHSRYCIGTWTLKPEGLRVVGSSPWQTVVAAAQVSL